MDDIPKQVSGHRWRGKPIEALTAQGVNEAMNFIQGEIANPSWFASAKETFDRLEALEYLKSLKEMYENMRVSVIA